MTRVAVYAAYPWDREVVLESTTLFRWRWVAVCYTALFNNCFSVGLDVCPRIAFLE